MSESNALEIYSETPKDRVQAIAAEIGKYFDDNGWTTVTRKECANGAIAFYFNMSVKSVPLRIDVDIAESPMVVRFNVTLPTLCASEYALLVDEFITEFNYDQRYGALKHDINDGTLAYEYNVSVAHTFDIDDFDTYFNVCLYSAANAYWDVSRLCVGRLSKAKLAELTEKLTEMTQTLNE
ncbi:MAG: hypothetical protein LBC41_14225 [Clostridiales bacterium]|jgi:hypothetical protein|nr:hypothetical protein [Clostridiales bacterium]MDR2751811.1 hypothetical protein [Clostridiales bacterium]